MTSLNPRRGYITEVAARQGLETPQIVSTWTEKDLEAWEYFWKQRQLVRSTYRFPESATDGTSIKTDGWDFEETDDSYADTACTADVPSYYSLLHQFEVMRNYHPHAIDADSMSKTNVTVTTGQTDPEAGTEADKVLETVAVGVHSITSTNTITPAGAVGAVIAYGFVKASGRTDVRLFADAANYIEVDLTDGSFSLGGGATDGSVIELSDSWYLVWVQGVTDGVAAARYGIYLGNGAAWSYGGDVTKGVFVWGMMHYEMTAGAFPGTHHKLVPLTKSNGEICDPLKGIYDDDCSRHLSHMEGGCFVDGYSPSDSGSDGATSIPASRLFSAGSKNFHTMGIEEGDILIVNDVGTPGDNGYYVVTGYDYNQILVDRNWPVGSLANLTYTIRKGHLRSWFGGRDHRGNPAIWRYDPEKGLADVYIDCSSFLEAREEIRAIAFVGTIFNELYGFSGPPWFGVATFTASTSETCTFDGYGNTDYSIRLTPSTDTTTGGIVGCAYSSKADGQFDIETTFPFTGQVSWEVTHPEWMKEIIAVVTDRRHILLRGFEDTYLNVGGTFDITGTFGRGASIVGAQWEFNYAGTHINGVRILDATAKKAYLLQIDSGEVINTVDLSAFMIAKGLTSSDLKGFAYDAIGTGAKVCGMYGFGRRIYTFPFDTLAPAVIDIQDSYWLWEEMERFGWNVFPDAATKPFLCVTRANDRSLQTYRINDGYAASHIRWERSAISHEEGGRSYT